MPQEFQVLRCYQCCVFQVHQVKKVNKWNCKMCGEKQSLKKVFFVGTGAECRQNVMRLNMMQKESNENMETYHQTNESHYSESFTTEPCQAKSSNIEHQVAAEGTKWARYLEETPVEEVDCDVPQGLENCVLNPQVSQGRKRKRNTEKPPEYGKQYKETSDRLNNSCSRLRVLCGSNTDHASQQPKGDLRNYYSMTSIGLHAKSIGRSNSLQPTGFSEIRVIGNSNGTLGLLTDSENPSLKSHDGHSETMPTRCLRYPGIRDGYSKGKLGFLPDSNNPSLVTHDSHSKAMATDGECSEDIERLQIDSETLAFQRNSESLVSGQIYQKSPLAKTNIGSALKAASSGASKWGKYGDRQEVDSDEVEDY